MQFAYWPMGIEREKERERRVEVGVKRCVGLNRMNGGGGGRMGNYFRFLWFRPLWLSFCNKYRSNQGIPAYTYIHTYHTECHTLLIQALFTIPIVVVVAGVCICVTVAYYYYYYYYGFRNTTLPHFFAESLSRNLSACLIHLFLIFDSHPINGNGLKSLSMTTLKFCFCR
jgi:hypothetical protein